MKINLAALAVGFLFALGLGISGMTQPGKVIGFLNIFGSWDPSLIFVMIGAISIHALTYRWVRRKPTPWFSEIWHLPTRHELTPSLVIGSIIFGIGWGLGGYCPGPALTSIASLQSRPLIFVVSMILGMVIFRGLDRKIKFKK